MAEDKDLIRITVKQRNDLEKAGDNILKLRKNITQLKAAGLPWEKLATKVDDMDKIRRGLLSVF